MAVSREFFEKQLLELLGPLQGVARRLTGNEAEAEDLVADTVVCALRGLDSLGSEAAFRAWMFRILNNTFISSRRKAAARPRTESLEAGDEEGAEAGDFSLFEKMHQPFLLWFGNPEQAFLDKLLRKDLECALAALPEHQRLIVVMSDLEECSYGEIAETLGIPIGTVRSRLARARAALQKALWQCAGEYGLKRPAAAAAGG